MKLNYEREYLEKFLERLEPKSRLKTTIDTLFKYLYDLKSIFNTPKAVLEKIPNINESVAFAISSFKEIFETLEEVSFKDYTYSSIDFKNYLINKFRYMNNENFYIVAINNKDKVQKILFVSEGNSFSVKLSFENLLNLIINSKAKKLVLIHNHPDGLPNPSFNDLETTFLLNKSLKKYKIKLLDHFIIGNKQMLSLKDNGIFEFIENDFEIFTKLVGIYAK